MESNGKMSTLKRIFGRARRLGNSPQRENKHVNKNYDSRISNTTTANEVGRDSNSEWNHTAKEEWNCDSESGSNASPTPTAPFSPEETPSKQMLFPEEPLLELTTEGGQEAEVTKELPPARTSARNLELGTEEHQQVLWSNLNAEVGEQMAVNIARSEAVQEMTVNITPRVMSDSVVSEDGDGVKVARSEGPDQQLAFANRLRHRCDMGRRGRRTTRHQSDDSEDKKRKDHRRHRADVKSEGNDDILLKGSKKHAIIFSSRDDLKRTATLPTLKRSSKIYSNTLLKDGVSSGSMNGPNRQSPSESHLNHRNDSSSIRTARSVILSNLIEPSSPTTKLASSLSSDADGTLSGSGTWSVTSEKNHSRLSSTSLVIVESNSKKKLSSEDVQHMFEEFARMQRDMRILIGNNENMWHRYEEDVAQLREEIDAVYVEVGNLTAELERCRKERSHGWNLDEKMLLSSVTVKTGRSSLTLHSSEAAEVAIAEQLREMEDDGSLVPFEGNQLVPLSSRSHSIYLNKDKPDYEGSFIRRGLMRAILEVSSKARRLWSMYTRMYPAL